MRDDREPEDDGDDFDIVKAFVADECPTCGAYMLNPELHRNWHRKISDAANRYKPPPVYG